MATLCKNCEHFKIAYEPQIIGGECWDWGLAVCERYNLETDFRSHKKFEWLSCIGKDAVTFAEERGLG